MTRPVTGSTQAIGLCRFYEQAEQGGVDGIAGKGADGDRGGGIEAVFLNNHGGPGFPSVGAAT